MEVKSHVVYNIEKSAGRIQEILDSNNSNYEDKGNVVPSRDSLTYNNGYYVNVTALFIDIVGSSKLIEECQRPTLAKMCSNNILYFSMSRSKYSWRLCLGNF